MDEIIKGFLGALISGFCFSFLKAIAIVCCLPWAWTPLSIVVWFVYLLNRYLNFSHQITGSCKIEQPVIVEPAWENPIGFASTSTWKKHKILSKNSVAHNIFLSMSITVSLKPQLRVYTTNETWSKAQTPDLKSYIHLRRPKTPRHTTHNTHNPEPSDKVDPFFPCANFTRRQLPPAQRRQPGSQSLNLAISLSYTLGR